MARLQLYNTLRKKKEPFQPIMPKKVRMYTCGPTVYDYPHIGNYRAYVVSDLLKRYLRYLGNHVTHIMNITDVDDKTIRGAQRKKVSLTEFTRLYETAFLEDLDSLRILLPDKFPRATEHIPEMVALIEGLLAKQLAYKAEDGSIYFAVGKFKDYGKLAHLDLNSLQSGASGRVSADEYSKESAHDFALWKAYTPEDGEVFWDTSLGRGRPGWHIECSAMSMNYLGETFDIHCGGIDLVFPHHQNEIAQSEGATGKRFVKYWIHNEWLLVEGQKMSKSLGNFFTLRDILKKGYDAKAIRYLLLSTHYRQPLNFTFAGLDAAKHSVERLQEAVRNLKKSLDKEGKHAEEQITLLITDARKRFEEALDDDLNISEGLAVVFQFIRDINKLGELSRSDADDALALLEDFDEIMGVLDFAESDELTEEQRALIEERQALRTQGKFKEADELRAKLAAMGIQLEDSAQGARWKKLK